MKRTIFTILCLAALLVSIGAAPKKKVHTIGDSTMQTYAETDTKRGWGQMLQQFFNADNITVNNRGKSGASSKSFYKEAAYWPTLVTGGSNQMQAGDILVIQFAHNDEKSNGTDGDEVNALGGEQVDYRGTTPSDTYKKYLRAYIDEAKKMGVKPVLCGPICRKYFKDDGGKKINRAGRHDLGDGFSKIVNGNVTTGNKVAADDHSMDYPYQMQQVAKEYDDVPYIDLTTATKEMYENYGDAYCTANIFCPDDGTHPGAMGATLIARLFAQLVHNQANGGETDAKRAAVLKELDEDIVLSSEITFSPTTGDMGKIYSGQTLTKEFNISAFGLTPAAGKVSVSVDAPFSISIDKNTFSQTIDIDYTGSTLISQVYVKTTGTGTAPLTGTLTASCGSMKSTLPLKVEIISLEGGEEVSVVWPLTVDATPVITGPIEALAETWEGMYAKDYNNINSAAVWPEGSGYDASHKTQRNGIVGDKWPSGDIDEVSTRYVQFAVQSPAETEINIDKISMYVAGAGGSGMRCKIYYSTHSDFSDPQQIYANTSMAGNTAYKVEFIPTEKIGEGERLYIRVYPWYNGEASGKTICISDLTVHGVATAASGDKPEIDPTIYTFGMGRDLDAEAKAFTDKAEKLLGTAPQHVKVSIANGSCNNFSSNAGNVTHGTTTTYSAPDRVRNYCTTHKDAVKDFDDHIFWGFKVDIDDGYQLNINKLYGDIYVEKNATAYKMGVFTSDAEDATPLYMSDVKSISNIQSCGADNVATTVDVADVAALKELTGTVYLRFYWWINSGAAGAVLKDFNIDCQIAKAAQTTKYALSADAMPAEGGSVSKDPELATYKAGAEVTLKAKKNFGYKFKEWQDGEGNTLGTNESLKLTMTEEKTVHAIFETVPVYTVKTSCTNDADRALGNITVTPDEHAGKYEAGTEITLKAEESKIMKFMQWTDAFENAGTSATRKVTVNSDMILVANYEVQDFIAVFDASIVQGYADRFTYPFAADLTWDENRKAQSSVVNVATGAAIKGQGSTPVVRNRTGVVISDINGLYQNGYYTTDIAWQYEFSTKGFTSARIEGAMAAKNSATKNWKAQYSLDGTTFTDIKEGGKWIATANVVNNISVTLPAEAINKDIVYVRFTGDGDELIGTSYAFDKTFDGLKYCDHSESGFGNLYVLGDAEVAADDVAPSVTSTIPANNATGVSATGTITISYDERIVAGNANGVATLDGKTLTPTWNSRSVSFQYGPLEYGKAYTFSIPEGYVQDKSGNKAAATQVKFTVMDRQKPAARTFNAIVDHSLTEKKIAATDDMPAQYRYIQDAIDDAPNVNEKPYLIYIKEGYYADGNETFNAGYGNRYANPGDKNDDTTLKDVPGGKNQYDDCKLIYVNKPNIHIIGQAVDKVTIATDRLDGSVQGDRNRVWYHINAGATLEVMAGAKDFYMENITLDNENWTLKGMAGPQALCVKASADRVAFNNMNVRSYQDTYYADALNNRQFWYKSTIEGSVDFIYGSGDVFFEGCTLNINRKDGGFIVAPNHTAQERWGYVFNNTRITTTYASDPSTYKIYFGRPWHENPKTVFLHTQCEVSTYDGYWYPTMGGLPSLWAVYDIWDKNGNRKSETSISDYYYTDGDGNKITGKAKNSLTAEEAATYTLDNVLAGDGTNDADKGRWNPLPLVEKTATPMLSQSGNKVTWTTDDYAICYVVTVNGKPVAFPTEASYDANEGDVITVQSVNEYGALSDMSAPLTVGKSTGIKDVNSMSATDSNSSCYNLAGQRVSNPKRGVYIMNGKTFVVK